MSGASTATSLLCHRNITCKSNHTVQVTFLYKENPTKAMPILPRRWRNPLSGRTPENSIDLDEDTGTDSSCKGLKTIQICSYWILLWCFHKKLQATSSKKWQNEKFPCPSISRSQRRRRSCGSYFILRRHRQWHLPGLAEQLLVWSSRLAWIVHRFRTRSIRPLDDRQYSYPTCRRR